MGLSKNQRVTYPGRDTVGVPMDRHLRGIRQCYDDGSGSCEVDYTRGLDLDPVDEPEDVAPAGPSKGKGKTRAKPKPKTKATPKTKGKAKGKAKAAPKTKGKTKTKAKAASKTKGKSKAKPKPKSLKKK